MHIPQHNNNNQAIVDCNHDLVPLCYFNIIKLKAGESYSYQLADYETCIVPASGSIDVHVQNKTFTQVGKRQHIWERDPEGVYVPVNCKAKLDCISDDVEVFISGAKHSQTNNAFVVKLNIFWARNQPAKWENFWLVNYLPWAQVVGQGFHLINMK